MQVKVFNEDGLMDEDELTYSSESEKYLGEVVVLNIKRKNRLSMAAVASFVLQK